MSCGLQYDSSAKEEYPWQNSVSDLFEQQVEYIPDAIAVVCEEQHVTYSTLNSRANQLAHHLQGLNVGPEAHIGLCMKRSLDQITGVLGILKAGAAYIPLDPDYPVERLAFMARDAHSDVLLVQEELLAHLPVLDATVICLDTMWEQIGREHDTRPVVGACAENLAYIIYTSGSTGKPKGITMGHAPLVNLLVWQRGPAVLPASARTLQFASLNFDVSFQEIFSTWLTGGTLLLISEQLRRDPAGLLALLEEQAVERLFFPFITLQNLAEVFPKAGVTPSHVREIIVAGEQLQINRHISHFLASLPDCVLHNHYGPSECHVVTSFTLRGSPAAWPALPSIGQAIANASIYILDTHMQPLPAGIAGEIYIGGDCLARGYHNRPDLTAERFLPDPFSQESGARIYKTGDTALYMPDGNIEFLGRYDQQVKIRGVRLELGEIEATACQHPLIQQCVVLVHDSKSGDKRLVAYIVPISEDAPLSYADVRQFLADKLPEYMVPSHFARLEQFPLTPSGKVDRRTLPAIAESRPALSETYSAPETAVEQQLVELWQNLLGLHRVGIHDNFFDLGGHSLLVGHMHARLEELFEVSIPIVDVFKYPTIVSLAAYLDQRTMGIQVTDAQETLKRGQSRAEKRKGSHQQRVTRK